ncbi:hypothetical protein BJ138DRAFT_84659 [Hygrophoropsis aurantiaca]|uniref:Uncharacterized protein n=1 Tax=Hygrophoropsis aurantiaca TaxID=72124 RepID=A0ACB8ABX8_9AGAM|nr:hypothetical protein BJ138DRAFT_84659 [Hygrophoropsis aurantiaca]
MNYPLQTETKGAMTDIVLELSPRQPTPLLPYELHNTISNDTWETRVRAIIRLASQYSKPQFERVWILIGIIATFIVPIITYSVAIHQLSTDGNHQDEHTWDARFISFGVTIATWLLFFMPVIVWKYLGQVRVRAMVAQWAKEDMKNSVSYTSLPTWKVSTPKIFRDGIILIISVSSISSHFHPDAFLPPYIGPPADSVKLPPYEAGKAMYNSSGQHGGKKFGDIPLFNDEKV